MILCVRIGRKFLILCLTKQRIRRKYQTNIFLTKTMHLFTNSGFRAPKDSLDFILASAYNETKELFAIKEDTYLQWETKGKQTWRRLRNTYEKAPPIIIPLVSYYKRIAFVKTVFKFILF